jgi:hypothetical protein
MPEWAGYRGAAHQANDDFAKVRSTAVPLAHEH